MMSSCDILLIDDDALSQYMVEDVVTQMGHRFHCAVDGESGREALAAGRFSLVILTRRLWVNGRMEVMSPAETRLLACLIRHLGEPLDRVLISKAICKREWVYGDRTVDVLVSRLRRRLRGSAAQIVTIHGMGYILTTDGAT